MKDIFLCHASINKDAIARPLFSALLSEGLDVWFDEAEIKWGDSISALIQHGLSSSRYVLVLLTPEFLDNPGKWRFEELNAALSSQIDSGRTSVLPIVYKVNHDKLCKHLPFVASRRYESINDDSDIARIAHTVKTRIVESTRPLFLVRTDVDPTIGSVESRIASTRTSLYISGNDCKYVAESLSPHIEQGLTKGIKVKILCVDPFSSAVEMLPKIDPRFPTAESFRESMIGVESKLLGMVKTYPNLELRYLPILPSIGFFMTDPDRESGIIKIELYLAQPFEPLDSRPHIVINGAMREWREYFIKQWENYWAMSRIILPHDDNKLILRTEQINTA